MLLIGAEGLYCCTHSNASNIGARQCAALHKQFAAHHQFPPTLPVIWAQVTEKHFKEI